ncbi:hypothetical protein VNO80_11122 [Phaseolus coccineus]|uniref:Uncharacterized protein n=1 Tax=Phaseolus coccineus TaxID=3886 RepID=A0AAN9NEP5_PHACN
MFNGILADNFFDYQYFKIQMIGVIILTLFLPCLPLLCESFCWYAFRIVRTLAQPREIVVLATYKLALGMEAGVVIEQNEHTEASKALVSSPPPPFTSLSLSSLSLSF